jgi:DnaJ like chaperone protein
LVLPSQVRACCIELLHAAVSAAERKVIAGMPWFGKIALGSLGMMFGGPLGAVLGAALGHQLIDKQQPAARGGFFKIETPFDNTRQQAAAFVCVLSMLAKIAKVDGVVTQDELAVVDRFIRALRAPIEEKKFARRIFNEAKNSPHSLEDFATQFYHMVRWEPTVLCSFLDTLFQVAAADGALHPDEEKAIRSVKEVFHVSDTMFDSILARYCKDDGKNYQMLNCTAQSTDEEIKRSYKKLVKEFHPDTIIAKGLPDEFIEFATRRFQEIQGAYEQIRKTRGL